MTDPENHTLALLREMRSEMNESIRRIEETQAATYDLLASAKVGEAGTLTRMNALERRLAALERRASGGGPSDEKPERP